MVTSFVITCISLCYTVSCNVQNSYYCVVQLLQEYIFKLSLLYLGIYIYIFMLRACPSDLNCLLLFEQKGMMNINITTQNCTLFLEAQFNSFNVSLCKQFHHEGLGIIANYNYYQNIHHCSRTYGPLELLVQIGCTTCTKSYYFAIAIARALSFHNVNVIDFIHQPLRLGLDPEQVSIICRRESHCQLGRALICNFIHRENCQLVYSIRSSFRIEKTY